jgi:hypothetical protein
MRSPRHAIRIAILISARLSELRKVAENTAAVFQNARRTTSMSATQISERMEAHLDKLRDRESP